MCGVPVGLYYIKSGDCEGGAVRPHEAQWEVGAGGQQPAPIVSCRDLEPESTLRRWTQGVSVGIADEVGGELGAAVGIMGSPVESDG